jgi:hypothetical protein
MHTEDEEDSGENRHNRDGFGTPLTSCASSYFTLQQTRCAHATTALQTRAQLFDAFCHGGQTDGQTGTGGREEGSGGSTCLRAPAGKCLSVFDAG